ncbi:large conductance mechanosensitive channel protein MscL [Planomicrobium chinense]|uniref:Large-conductance mechanosensitive channel n=1 Tax=Planococcus glaciei TaxID=459472 RepID=A0A7H8QD25_9BACL|nr:MULTISPECIES: large conductance mechanosensitive channel protein MscL [Planococcus]MCP2034872.1 large conductance mechanosensitive channel [Planomicrobium sp. HSC-17F08]ETP67963.1 large conductance mechanosensitive channel protein MscL [Planococcus glaciei CHR43]KOF09592.1 Large-conductance mechanosensitive channel [Planococcus glaciei]MBX0314883.1 large conductance mechanosensitive channel protein MscL [Planococcus glaciei]MBZ5201707.1 large conductance mechanosensitive channel protein Msc
MWEDFKKFALKGNVLDLAIAVVIGAAFGKIVSSLVEDIIMPAVGILLGGFSVEDWTYTFQGAELRYGLFAQSVIDFFIIAFSIFLVIRIFTKLKRKKDVPAEVEPEVLDKKEELLVEIRDLLAKEKTGL